MKRVKLNNTVHLKSWNDAFLKLKNDFWILSHNLQGFTNEFTVRFGDVQKLENCPTYIHGWCNQRRFPTFQNASNETSATGIILCIRNKRGLGMIKKTCVCNRLLGASTRTELFLDYFSLWWNKLLWRTVLRHTFMPKHRATLTNKITETILIIS
jgi:hypothetical protein